MSGDTRNVQVLNELKEDAVTVLNNALEALGARSVKSVSGSQLKALKKNKMSELFHDTLSLLADITSVITSDFAEAPNSVKRQMFESQQTIIKLQSELIECKNEQLESFKTVVTSSVGETVKSEFKTYSSALQANLVQSKQPVNTEELKKAVQTVVQEEDRGKNLMIFNLPEQENEEIGSAVAGVFEALGEKPRAEACRLGKKKTDKSTRPVKVNVANSTVVSQILSKARKLRKVSGFESVFVCPDRSIEQRAKQKLLVTDLKRLVKEQIDKKHFIKNGEIMSVDKKNQM